MIAELSNSEIDKMIDYGQKWTAIGLSTQPLDMQKAVLAIAKAYTYAGLTVPKIFLGPFNNPLECAKAQVFVKKLSKTTDIQEIKDFDIPAETVFELKDIEEALREQLHGFSDSSWLCAYEYAKDVLDLPELFSFEGLFETAQNVGWWAPYGNVVFVQERPLEIHFNEKGELHNDNGPAIKWRGEDRSMDIYIINGEVQPPPAEVSADL
jgi:hypothetical protein